MKRTLTILFLIVASVSLAFGQTRTLTGNVTSALDGQPLPGVTVVILGTSGGVTTDGNGNSPSPSAGPPEKCSFHSLE